MRSELLATYTSKYSSPFCAWLAQDDTNPSWGNSTDGPMSVTWHGGRHFTVEDSSGAVEHVKSDHRFSTGVEVWHWVREAFPDVADWEDQEELENDEEMYGHDWHG